MKLTLEYHFPSLVQSFPENWKTKIIDKKVVYIYIYKKH